VLSTQLNHKLQNFYTFSSPNILFLPSKTPHKPIPDPSRAQTNPLPTPSKILTSPPFTSPPPTNRTSSALNPSSPPSIPPTHATPSASIAFPSTLAPSNISFCNPDCTAAS